MTSRSLILMPIVVFLVLRALKKDFVSGLALGVAFFVSLPDYMRLSIGGGIPEMTIHRVLLIVLALKWRSASKLWPPHPPVPFFRLMVFFLGSQVISFLLSIHFTGSMKSVFVYALEVSLLFYIVSTSLRSTDDVRQVLKAMAYGLGAVAVIAFFERRWEINYSKQILLGDGWAGEDIVSTYTHRILLGYAMAMGVPITFALVELEKRKRTRQLLWVMLLLLMAGCYFSNSRGPWSGLVMGGGVLVVLGSRMAKKSAVYVAILGIIAMIARPGIRETFGSALFSTFQETDSLKAASYQYRWRLWYVAWSEIKKSPERLLFGYGGLSTETMDLSSYFEKEAGGNTALLGFTSWDNQLACDLIEYGVVGFGLEAALLLSVMAGMISVWRSSPKEERSLAAAFLGTCVIFSYAMSNVYIFAPQVKCLFWSLVACGGQYARLKQLELAAPPAVPVPVIPAWARTR